MTPEEGKKNESRRSDQLSEVLKMVELQVRKEMDSVRGRLYWQKALEEIPHEVMAEALAIALSSKSYQEIPRCQCCCRRG